MAFVFTVFCLMTGTALLIALRAYLGFSRRRGWLLNPYLPAILIVLVASVYLVAKVAYEEIYPCVAVDHFYCDFDSTQYHNLFGWEF